jgi:hypothetical protein
MPKLRVARVKAVTQDATGTVERGKFGAFLASRIAV